MTVVPLLGLLAVTLVWGAPAALTVLGARARGCSWRLALASGLAYPIAWMVWYVVDERPRRRAGRLSPR